MTKKMVDEKEERRGRNAKGRGWGTQGVGERRGEGKRKRNTVHLLKVPSR